MTGDSRSQPTTALVAGLRLDAEMLKDGFQKNLTELWHGEVVRDAAKNSEAAAARIEELEGALREITDVEPHALDDGGRRCRHCGYKSDKDEPERHNRICGFAIARAALNGEAGKP